MEPNVTWGIRLAFTAIWLFVAYRALMFVVREAYEIRLHSIKEYGPTIHEFDPYFNLRATEYLYEHGWKKFVTWFDYMSWYPLGRPVGTTIYPGLQVTAVAIKNYILRDSMSLYDICVYIPAWFGVIASLSTGLLAYECALPVSQADEAPFRSILEDIPVISWIYKKALIPVFNFGLVSLETVFATDFGLRQRSKVLKPSRFIDLSSPALECGIISASIMAIVPAHMMRSPGGGFDNEAIAMTAMTLTFYFWTRSLRGGIGSSGVSAALWGVVTGLAYFYMVAAWGGYVFVINLIGCHAAVLVLLGRYSDKLYYAYSTFYLVGTSLATQVPVVNLTPLKSLEQMGPLALFVGMQLLQFVEFQRRRRNLSHGQVWILRVQVFGVALSIVGVGVFLLSKMGYFGPVSSRVRGLFIKHTKTGNPLVDSVAEHQPATSDAYDRYLSHIVSLLPVGVVMVAFRHLTDSSSFLLVYAAAAYFFSLKMVRLLLLTSPIASVLAGSVLGRILGFILYNIFEYSPNFFDFTEGPGGCRPTENCNATDNSKLKSTEKKKTKNKTNETTKATYTTFHQTVALRYLIGKVLIFAAMYFYGKKMLPYMKKFRAESHELSVHLSHPSILFKGTLRNGTEIVVDDYREAYWWLRDNTPQDSRIMAWWDYGYQIAGIANRTTLADGNTWNHEHIALLGRMLTGPEKESHRIARHLADYILLWTGGGGDDLAKSPHLARIANSVYRNMCPNDPICAQFTRTEYGPSKMMSESLLYRLHSNRLVPGVVADPNRFQEVFMSKYGKVRIYKILSVSEESKRWIADPANRVCDAPGSWYCRGQYPPALNRILAEKRDFSQLEDFNKKGHGDDDAEYQRKYFESLGISGSKENKKNTNRDSSTSSKTSEKTSKEHPSESVKKTQAWKPNREVDRDTIARLNNEWEDNEMTTTVWDLISQGKVKELTSLLSDYPEAAFLRSSDGRGPMWWAHEFGNSRIIRVLKTVGVRDDLIDASGMNPKQLLRKTGDEL